MKTLTYLLLVLAFTAQALSLPIQYSKNTPRQASINAIVALITQLFPVNVVITAAVDLVANAEQAIGTAMGFQMTREDLDNGVCGDVLVVFARGTAETGNVGSLVGPELFNALGSALGSGKTVAVQGVDNYPASVTEYLQGGSPEGSAAM